MPEYGRATANLPYVYSAPGHAWPYPYLLNPGIFQKPTPILHFIVYAWIGPNILQVQPPHWEQISDLFPSPTGAEALCQFMWDRIGDWRPYRVFWNLGQGTPLTLMVGGDRPSWKWFDDLGCMQLGWWKDVDWEKLVKGPQ